MAMPTIRCCLLLVTVLSVCHVARCQPATVVIEIGSPAEGSVVFQRPWSPGNPSLTVPINETDADYVVLTLVAKDNITGKILTDYQKVPESDPGNFFTVNVTTGQVTLAKAVDFETLPPRAILSFRVKAVTSGPTPRDAITSVNVEVQDVNDNEPTFLQEAYTFTVKENVDHPYRMGVILATDEDSDNYGSVAYSLVGDGAADFFVDPSGYIYTASAADLNYNTRSMYNLTVVAIDNPGGNPGDTHSTEVPLTILLVDVNDNSPQFPTNRYIFYVNVFEELLEVVVKAQDPDGPIRYSLAPNNYTFYVETSTGIIRSLKLLDLARKDPYVLTVIAWDSFVSPPLSIETEVWLFVGSYTSIEVVFPPDGYTVHVEENTPGNTSILNVTAVNPVTESPEDLVFGFIPSDSGDEEYFHIDPGTGRITVNYDSELDRETKQDYEFTIHVHTTVGPPLTHNFRLRVRLTDQNDTEPSFDCPKAPVSRPTVATLSEDVSVDTFVVQVSACDSDEVSDIKYTLIEGHRFEKEDGSLTQHFTINNRTGEIVTHATLDREQKAKYSLMVAATSYNTVILTRIPHNVLNVVITITDVDDSSPSFGDTFADKIVTGVLTTAAYGSEVIRVYAIDPDSSFPLTYSFGTSAFVGLDGRVDLNGNDAPFAINSATGHVTSSQVSFINNTDGYYEIQVFAIDSAQRRATTTLYIVVIRESGLMRYIIDVPLQDFRDLTQVFMREVNFNLNNEELVTAHSLRYHIKEDGEPDTDKSDLCFYLIDGKEAVDVDNAIDTMEDHKDNKPKLRDLYGRFKISNIGRCEVNTTTKWRSGYWWLLIALALLIFVLALIYVIFIWVRWDRLHHQLLHRMKYEVNTVPVARGRPTHLPEHE